MKIAYCDCFSGISGDMFLGALLDAGLSFNILKDELAKLHITEEYELKVSESQKGALRATQFQVILHDHSEHDHHHHHRHLEDITKMISSSDISEGVKVTSLKIFNRLAQAEAQVHGQPVEQVHFHEVGAVDSIIDIVGAAIGLETLGIEALYASSLPYGEGQVMTDHGLLPLPAPATLQILAGCGAPLHSRPTQAELVTPTGAAILAALAKFEQPNMTLQRVGTGSGMKDLSWPNILRVWTGEIEAGHPPKMVLLETNIDDMNPEFFGHTMEKLFASGARDVFMTPIYMKKNRPATLLSVLALEQDQPELTTILFRETSTLGIRVQPVSRIEAGRRMEKVPTLYGEIPVKLKLLDGEVLSASPEYEACSRIAKEKSVPIREVYQAAMNACAHLPKTAGQK